MSSLFSLDSPFMRFMSRVADLLILNLLCILTSIPVFTIGASVTAMYTVCFRFGTDREEGTFRSYFRAFKANFKQATILWLILLVVLYAAFYNTIFFYAMSGLLHALWILCAFLLALALFITSYAFPLVSQFESTNRKILKNSLLLSIAYLPRSILMAVINALPIALILTRLDLFFQAGFLWFTLYFGVAAYVNSRLLRKVFAPYWNPDEAAQPLEEGSSEQQEENTEEVSQ